VIWRLGLKIQGVGSVRGLLGFKIQESTLLAALGRTEMLVSLIDSRLGLEIQGAGSGRGCSASRSKSQHCWL